MAFETACLYSTVRNVSGQTMKFGFLPPHGRELAADEEVTVFGDIREAVVRNQRNTSQHHVKGLIRALDGTNDTGGRLLAIINTPAVFLFDETDGQTVTLICDNATLDVATPCTETSI